MLSSAVGLFIVGSIACILLVGILAEVVRIRQTLEDKHKQ